MLFDVCPAYSVRRPRRFWRSPSLGHGSIQVLGVTEEKIIVRIEVLEYVQRKRIDRLTKLANRALEGSNKCVGISVEQDELHIWIGEIRCDRLWSEVAGYLKDGLYANEYAASWQNELEPYIVVPP